MKGLIIKDLNYLRRTSILSLLAVLFVLYVVLGLIITHNFTGFSGIIILVCSMLSVTTFSYDSQDGFNNLLFTLPVTKNKIVLSKYITTVLLTLLGLLAGLAYSLLMSVLRKYNISTDEMIYNFVSFEIAVMAISIIIPIIFKMGVEKARLLIVSFVIMPFVGALIIEKLGITITQSTIDLLIKISPIICLSVVAVSYFISVRIYKKKGINDSQKSNAECFSKNFN